jgi:hypothetical protein
MPPDENTPRILCERCERDLVVIDASAPEGWYLEACPKPGHVGTREHDWGWLTRQQIDAKEALIWRVACAIDGREYARRGFVSYSGFYETEADRDVGFWVAEVKLRGEPFRGRARTMGRALLALEARIVDLVASAVVALDDPAEDGR